MELTDIKKELADKIKGMTQDELDLFLILACDAGILKSVRPTAGGMKKASSKDAGKEETA